MNDASANAMARRALMKIDATTTLEAVDSLDLRANAKVSAVVGVPLRQLQQRRDVEAFAVAAPIMAVKGLLEVLAMAPLESMIAALGEHSESPSFEQLRDAVDQLLAAGTSVDDVVAVLAFAISESFPAAGHCRRLFDEREDFALPELPEIESNPVLAVTKVVDPEVRAQRKARREALSQRKKARAPSRPPHGRKPKSSTPTSAPAPSARPVTVSPTVRRTLALTALEQSRFDDAHAMVGAVVLVDVPYEGVDPETPELSSKERPALVVAASSDELLVRALYSSPAPTRQVFSPWRRLGLDHVSYLEDARVAVASSVALRRLGVLSDAEWNSVL